MSMLPSLAVVTIPPIGSQDNLSLDPAQRVLLEAKEAKKQRRREETERELAKIQGRIEDTLNEFECRSSAVEVSKSDVNFQLVEDPLELCEMLADSRTKRKYQQHIAVFIVRYEEMCTDRERLLESLQEFFLEMQAGNTQQVLKEVAAEEIDFGEVTQGLESALETAQNAAQKLLEIKQEMAQLFSIAATYPDTKKGRKKLEKALLKSQEEVQGLSNTLQAVQGELEQSKAKCDQLQKQVESKSAECTRLRKTADQMKKLQVTNDSLQVELSSVQAALRKAQIELEKAQSTPAKTEPIVKEVVKMDEGKVCELETLLSQERETYQKVVAEKEEMEEKFHAELESLRAEHESEIEEMRSRYEDQLKSLMEEDLFDAPEEEVEEEEDGLEVTQKEEERFVASPVEMEGTSVEEEDDEASEKKLLTSSSYVARVKMEGEAREKKLQEELTEVKAKSRKAVTALRAQLVEAENTHKSEVGSLKKEMSNLSGRVEEMECQNASLQERLSALEEKKQQLERELQQSTAVEQKQRALLQQLQEERSAGSGQTGGNIPLEELVNRSAQWSEPSGQMTPRSLPPHLTSSHATTTPITLPMDEVPFEDNTLQFGSPVFFPSSLQQSVTSFEPAPLGSLLHSTSGASDAPAIPPLHSMLAQSRLSHYSTSTPLHLTFDHPVVAEWTKAYDMMVKFKDGVVDLLSENENTVNIVEDLKSLEVHMLDRDQEVSGEITQMRFSLALMLHQIEQTLQESFARMGAMEERGRGGGGGGGGEEEEREGLREVMAQLTRRLRHTEETHKIEMEESKETIANLSSKVENLKMQMATLCHSLSQHNDDEDSEKRSIMFTRLDSERNKRTLKATLEENKISPSTYDMVTESMEEYLSIPPRRLAHLTQHCQHKTTSSRLIEHVRRSYPDTEHAVRIVQRITSLDERRKAEFSATMKELVVRRIKLAHSLTNTLSHIEKKAQVFLIKPVYTSGCSRTPALITPIARALPLVPHRTSRPRSTAVHGDRRTPHPNMQLVNRLLQSRQSQRGEQNMTVSTCVSGQGSHWKCQGAASTQPEWSIEASRAAPLPPPTAPHPSLPKMLELEILRQRQPDALLSHLLPHTSPHPHSSPQRLTTLDKRTVTVNTSLPPIHIPSKAHGPITVS